MSNEFPFSERYRLAGVDWADKEAAANLLEETKTSIMAQKQSLLGDIPVNRAEQIVKASPDWMTHLETICEARKQANLAKVKMDTEKMRFYEMQSREANARSEMRL